MSQQQENEILDNLIAKAKLFGQVYFEQVYSLKYDKLENNYLFDLFIYIIKYVNRLQKYVELNSTQFDSTVRNMSIHPLEAEYNANKIILRVLKDKQKQ